MTRISQRIAVWMALPLLAAVLLAALPALAQEANTAAQQKLAAVAVFETYFKEIVSTLSDVLFYPILGFPALVLWLITGSVFFTFSNGFVNIRLLPHAFGVVRGRFAKPNDPGEITHFQAMATAVSGTVGLGNIAGVAVAVSIGGPGAVIWMMVAAFFGMSLKFTEALLGHKYREIDPETGMVKSGAFLYLRNGLKDIGMEKVGLVLSFIFALFCLGGSFGAGNMFQANQTVSIMTTTFAPLAHLGWVIALALAVLVGVILIGGITRIASVTEKMVPFMAVSYILACLVVILSNIDLIGESVALMFSDAFTGEAVGGGILGAIVTGFQRSAFSNEAGIGSASIVHPTARNPEPVRAGCTAVMEPVIDTMIICFMTGLVITMTGVYQDTDMSGVALTAKSFGTVIDWFPMVLSVCVFFFALSTMITWSYYGEQAWIFLFKGKGLRLYQIMFCTMTFFGGASNKMGMILEFSDLLLLSMALPNIVGLYLMSGVVRAEVRSYIARLKAGEVMPVAQPQPA